MTSFPAGYNYDKINTFANSQENTIYGFELILP